MTYTRKNKGVCSLSTTVTLHNGIIKNVALEDGCDGNGKGLCKLLEGKTAEEAIQSLSGITCEKRSTSCPDQIALCLKEALETQK